MPIRNLEKIFRPKHVAVIGASQTADSVGWTVLQNLADAKFPGAVYPVNPEYKYLADHPCFATVAELPQIPDLAVVCTPAQAVPQVVQQCGQAGIAGLVILSPGFHESGNLLETELHRQARAFDDMRIIGPNCLGIITPYASLNVSRTAGMPAKGNVAFISQSGALCTSMLDWALRENIGFSHFVSVGNMMDVSIADLIDYFATDYATNSIILSVESITQAREFMSAARAFGRQKPIFAYTSGPLTASAANSPTAGWAGLGLGYEAAFNRAGIVHVSELSDVFDCLELLARPKAPQGPRLAIVTNARGPAELATDALLDRNGILAELSPETMDQLSQSLPDWSHRHPIVTPCDAEPQSLSHVVQTVLADRGVDAVLVLFEPTTDEQAMAAANAVIEVAKSSTKPVLASWMGGITTSETRQLFNQAGIPTYSTPQQAVRAFMYLVSHVRIRDVLYETPRDIPVEFALDRNKLRAVFDTILSEGRERLAESTSTALLDAYDIPIAKPYFARTAEEAVQIAHRLGHPVAIKVQSPEIPRRSDVGGLALSLSSDEEVIAAFEQTIANAKTKQPDANIEGVTVQKMVTGAVSHELIVGVKRDRTFGAVLHVGTSSGLDREYAVELPPLSERLARRMLESLMSWPRLKGRGDSPAVNIDRLIEVLMRFSYLVADYPEISELEVNPLLVTADDVIALNASITLDEELILNPPRPYAHLAIRPYPEEYTRTAKLKDGTPILLRPIKPEDEPMWHELLASCSQESLWLRFRCLFKQTTHEMATRFCYLDYDRELAIVAEIKEEGRHRLIGVGGLVADADHTDAEYAILVADAYQGLGLGSLLTNYCLEICQGWGIDKVVAETAPENRRMLSIFEHCGFELDRSVSSDVVVARKLLR